MSASTRLLVADAASGLFLDRVRKSPAAAGFEITAPGDESEEALCAAAREAEVILCYKARLPGPAIRAASSLKLIQKHGLNCKNIDLAAASERGVAVATQPLLRNATVAEQALALMLACARKLVPGHRAVAEAAYLGLGLEPIRTSQWQFRSNWARIEGVTELFGSTAGIVGLGDIGMEVARRCRAFGMEVAYHQRTPHSKEVEDTYEARYLPLDELLAAADYLVLVLPHTPESEGLIGPSQLARMKPTATLINVGRGALVDEEALVRALREGRIAMAGLDVYRWEPLPESSPLRALPNVVLLPHTGGGSDRSWGVDVPASLENIRRFFRGEPPRGLIRPGRA